MRATLRLAVAGWCLTVVSGALVLSREPTRQASNADIGTATLTGRVIRGESSNRTPVGRVVVNISLGDGSGTRQAVTDDQGRFGFDRLPAAGFLVTASRPGWVTTYYGSPRPGRPPGVRVAVADGAKVDIEIPIVPGAVIAGRIISEDGQPRPREFPLLLEKRLVGNQQMLSRMRLPYGIGYFERSTNDLGEFRLFGLPPGTYYLLVNPSVTSGARLTTRGRSPVGAAAARFAGGAVPPQGAVAGYAPFYYPGTSDPSESQPIVIGPGEVREGLVFRVGFVPVARVEGVVRRSDGTPAAGARLALDVRVPQVNIEGSGASIDGRCERAFCIPERSAGRLPALGPLGARFGSSAGDGSAVALGRNRSCGVRSGRAGPWPDAGARGRRDGTPRILFFFAGCPGSRGPHDSATAVRLDRCRGQRAGWRRQRERELQRDGGDRRYVPGGWPSAGTLSALGHLARHSHRHAVAGGSRTSWWAARTSATRRSMSAPTRTSRTSRSRFAIASAPSRDGSPMRLDAQRRRTSSSRFRSSANRGPRRRDARCRQCGLARTGSSR